MAKKMWVLALTTLLAAGLAFAQQQQSGGVEKHATTEVLGAKAAVMGPTYADVYCAGYITSQPPQRLGYVAAGWESPHQNVYGTHDYVYLDAANLEPGKTYEIVREVADSNHMRSYKWQQDSIKKVGKVYFEMGSVKVMEQRGRIAISEVAFSCDGIMPGDMVVPMPDRPIPQYHAKMAWDRFAAPNGKTTGRILLARDFDTLIGERSKVYLDIGADRGLKVGDYFRVTRTYTATHDDEVDRISYGPRDVISDDQKNATHLSPTQVGILPRRSLGELVITEVTPHSATGVVTFALEEMFIGDGVEMMDVPPPVVEAPPAPMGPSIACTAMPATVRQGDTSNINCDGQSPDNRPLTYSFATDRGSVSPRENVAVLATRDAAPGPITVNATVTDDRNLSASTSVVVNVEAPPPAPQPTMAGEVAFKTNSAYVDNRAKAMLDGIALRMNQERDTKAVVIGFADPKESKTLAARRAANVKAYLVKTKGIDAARIETRTATNATGKKAEVWLVPAGATMP